MSLSFTEKAKVMVAQGLLTQEQFDQLFGVKKEMGDGIAGGNPPVSPLNGSRMPGQEPAEKRDARVGHAPAQVGAERVPSPSIRIGKDEAAGVQTLGGVLRDLMTRESNEEIPI